MGNDTDEVETYRAFRSCRLRRYRGGSDLACTDFNEIFHLREEDRLLKQFRFVVLLFFQVYFVFSSNQNFYFLL